MTEGRTGDEHVEEWASLHLTQAPGGFVGRLVFAGFIGSILAFLLVALRFETLLGSTHDVKLTIRLVLAAVLFLEAFLVLANWRGANQRLVQRVLNRVWGPRGAMNRREKTFARICRDVLTLVGILWLAAGVFELLTATVGY